MLKLLLCLFITAFITHAEPVLQPSYTYTNETIYSTDLFRDVPKFKLFILSKYRKKHTERADTIVKKFAKHNLKIGTNGLEYIVFEKYSDLNTTLIEAYLRNYYLNNYPTLTIKTVVLTPSAFYDSLPKTNEVELSKGAYKNNDGYCYVEDKYSKKRYYFHYEIDATVDVLVARVDIGRNMPITKFNTVSQAIPFEDSNYKPFLLGDTTYIAKRVLRKGTPITYREIKVQPLVQKNQNVVVVITDGGLIVEFTAKANENGFLHDIISLTKSNGTRIQAQVIGPGRVLLE